MYAYIHIPFCRSKCTYCAFYSKSVLGKYPVPDEYVHALLAQAAFMQRLYGFGVWNSIYIGGGTPGLLSEKQLHTLISGLTALCPLDSAAETTLEVNCADIQLRDGHGINPYLAAAAGAGVNRISAGVQTLDDRVLLCIGRRSNALQVRKALENLCEWRLHSKCGANRAQSSSGQQSRRRFSCDLIAGLPLLSMDSFVGGLNEVLLYKPDHLSLYALSIEDGTPLQRSIQNGTLDWDEDKADRQWIAGSKMLIQAGYRHYEVSNFALDGCQSIHNSAYWHMNDYIGLGVAASGTVGGVRFTGTEHIDAYIAYWLGSGVQKLHRLQDIPSDIMHTEILDTKTRIAEFLMMGFRLFEGVSAKEFFKRFGFPIENVLGAVFKRWQDKELAERSGGFYRLNEKGMLFLNRFLCEALDAFI
ncbi:coproporphyrinogen-III oxidase family protein [Treponema lecithinolyticum]|uniref:Oxygen-independent coproporphyrinogen III oxidase n=1 Tax=Treponema lecithinolyticum ATCC 700332 TaxID=1321815 RepID=A0ABN0NXN0_TRELE|nr:coproporphyrinogen-III oxidase family protein [Treponema lecithinolyticum]ERJ92301.1 putative oxygen-independent coproporphyrinogen III oxidase [Treponema lecithinolyticum ATCC 700332]